MKKADSKKKVYEKPKVVFARELEALAEVCTAKAAGGTCKTTIGGGCHDGYLLS